MIKTADWIIDLGPDGGELVAEGHAGAGGGGEAELYRAVPEVDPGAGSEAAEEDRAIHLEVERASFFTPPVSDGTAGLRVSRALDSQAQKKVCEFGLTQPPPAHRHFRTWMVWPDGHSRQAPELMQQLLFPVSWVAQKVVSMQ